MTDPIRVKTYHGDSPAAAARMFQADAADAARAGFTPTSQQWEGSTLTVVYQRQVASPSPQPSREGLERVRVEESRSAATETMPPIIKTYAGSSQQQALDHFRIDAAAMATIGYQPVSQQWVADDAGRGCFWLVIVIILFITIIGILLLPFVLGGRKSGTLTVTYVYQGGALPAGSGR